MQKHAKLKYRFKIDYSKNISLIIQIKKANLFV